MAILLFTLLTAFMTPVDLAWYGDTKQSAFIEAVNIITYIFFTVDIVVSGSMCYQN
jgi:hypothetical protein